MSYDAANQLLSEDHPSGGPKTCAYDPTANRLSQDATWNGVRTLTNWTYDAADQVVTEDASGQLTTFQFDAAGNQEIVTKRGFLRRVQVELPGASMSIR